MIEAANLEAQFDQVTDYWSPKIVGAINNQYVKIAKLKGEFVWHDHENEDEFFYVVKGELTLEFEDKRVILGQGDFYIVPQSVRHKPIAEEECWVMLVEPKSTAHTGKEVTPMTKAIEDQF